MDISLPPPKLQNRPRRSQTVAEAPRGVNQLFELSRARAHPLKADSAAACNRSANSVINIPARGISSYYERRM